MFANWKNIKILLPVALMVLVCSCRDSIDFVAGPITGNVEGFFDNVQTHSKSLSFENSMGAQIITSNFSVITIPSNAFVDNSGAVIEGAIDFEYIELLDKGLMMLYKVPTTTTASLIESDGVFHLSASHNNSAVKLDDDVTINIKLPNNNPRDQMELFYGNDSGDGFNWIEADDNPNTWENIQISEWVVTDSTTGNGFEGFGYEFEINDLQWINCDIYYDLPNAAKTDVCIQLPEELYNNVNTTVYMVINDINSFAVLQGNPDTKKFCEPYGLTPIGLEVTFVTISEISEDNYHFGTKTATITENFEGLISPEEKSLNEILDILGMF